MVSACQTTRPLSNCDERGILGSPYLAYGNLAGVLSTESSILDSAHVNGRRDEWRRVALGWGTQEGLAAGLLELEVTADVQRWL